MTCEIKKLSLNKAVSTNRWMKHEEEKNQKIQNRLLDNSELQKGKKVQFSDSRNAIRITGICTQPCAANTPGWGGRAWVLLLALFAVAVPGAAYSSEMA